MDRLRALEVFVTVVSRQGFARAAETLDTSPANVTRYVSELEAHLGTRLLNRHSRKLSLTEGGEALYERARSILEDMAEAEAITSSATLKPQGRLRINAPLSFGVLHLAPLWPRFSQCHPDVELEVTLIDRVVDIVEEGFDLAIRISRGGSAEHAARRLAASRNVVCASPAYLREHGQPKRPADLARHACVGYTYAATANDWRFVDEDGGQHAVKVPYVMQTNNGDTAVSAALAGMGVIWQPTFLVGVHLRAGRLVALLPDYRMPDIDVLAVYPSRRHLSAKIRVMIDFLAAEFSGVAPWDRD
ncbi:MAG: LysR family transcriptional regulator [Betaproteobacteria bacterium]